METDEAARLSRRAFLLSLVWPVVFLSLVVEIPPFTELSRALGAFLVYAGGIVSAILAVQLGRRVRRAHVPDRALATVAEVLGWIEIVLFLFARSDWTF